jgi:hypothetical protein
LERREVARRNCVPERQRLTASAAFLKSRIPADFEQRLTELKTNPDFFVNGFLGVESKTEHKMLWDAKKEGGNCTFF